MRPDLAFSKVDEVAAIGAGGEGVFDSFEDEFAFSGGGVDGISILKTWAEHGGFVVRGFVEAEGAFAVAVDDDLFGEVGGELDEGSFLRPPDSATFWVLLCAAESFLKGHDIGVFGVPDLDVRFILDGFAESFFGLLFEGGIGRLIHGRVFGRLWFIFLLFGSPFFLGLE